ncbi:uncharacterized protein ASCRUDRAFT_78813 [Ascoidea rubescens DSM 1968]|uniref:Uncharacterized protein n=1 Tax=Ascoidea rubescens DSM 1968 TaxID=1344418 RepID=A0A1D2VQ94_9ASCO|nr:hypothetical protein ASCRUDRAFT_78813 [Ascoidea rubescens DSM 1968]ODV63792.1 hypothetical protein ASCRUDRAFT_78813 [Ascoidea rubescens DSM 1968]
MDVLQIPQIIQLFETIQHNRAIRLKAFVPTAAELLQNVKSQTRWKQSHHRRHFTNDLAALISFEKFLAISSRSLLYPRLCSLIQLTQLHLCR